MLSMPQKYLCLQASLLHHFGTKRWLLERPHSDPGGLDYRIKRYISKGDKRIILVIAASIFIFALMLQKIRGTLRNHIFLLSIFFPLSYSFSCSPFCTLNQRMQVCEPPTMEPKRGNLMRMETRATKKSDSSKDYEQDQARWVSCWFKVVLQLSIHCLTWYIT